MPRSPKDDHVLMKINTWEATDGESFSPNSPTHTLLGKEEPAFGLSYPPCFLSIPPSTAFLFPKGRNKPPSFQACLSWMCWTTTPITPCHYSLLGASFINTTWAGSPPLSSC